MICISPWVACVFMNGDGGGMDGQGSRRERGGRRAGKGDWLVCKRNKKYYLNKI